MEVAELLQYDNRKEKGGRKEGEICIYFDPTGTAAAAAISSKNGGRGELTQNSFRHLTEQFSAAKNGKDK